MPTTTTWQIGESGTAVTLDDEGRGEVTFTVTNTSSQQDRVVLTITPLDGAADSWFTVEEPQRAVAPGASAIYKVAIEVPPGTAPAVYGCQAVAYSADHAPEETSVTSKRVTVEVKKSEPPPPGFPKWIFFVIAAAVLLIAVVLFLILRDGGGGLEARSQPVIAGTAEVGQVLETEFVEWSEADVEAIVRWERCNPDGEECQPIDGATNLVYPVGNADVESRLRVSQTATRGDESATVSSEVTDVVAPPVVGEPVEVPPVVGDSRSVAIGKLSPTFVVVHRTAGSQSSDCDPLVEDQNPGAGSFLQPGDQVTIVTRPLPPILQCIDIRFPVPIEVPILVVDQPRQPIPGELFDDFDLEGRQVQP